MFSTTFVNGDDLQPSNNDFLASQLMVSYIQSWQISLLTQV